MAIETRKAVISGVSTTYAEAGEPGRPALVLIHSGAFSQDGFFNNVFCWEMVLEALGEEFHVFAVETLGQGGTALPPERAELAFDSAIDHVAEFIAAMELTDVHLVGHDEGALIAVRLAFNKPDLVRSCCVVNPNSLTPPGDSIENPLLTAGAFAFGSPEAQRWVLERTSASRAHVAAGTYLATAETLAASDADLDIRRDQRERISNSINRLRIDNFARFRDEGFPVPILILWGSEDPLAKRTQAGQWGLGHLYCAAASGRSLFDAIAPKQPLTQLRLISGAGYMPFREAPAAFAGSVAGFITAIENNSQGST